MGSLDDTPTKKEHRKAHGRKSFLDVIYGNRVKRPEQAGDIWIFVSL